MCEFTDQADDLSKIFSLDVAYYALRRLPYICGSHSDAIVAIRRRVINKYEKKYKTKYVNVNENVDW